MEFWTNHVIQLHLHVLGPTSDALTIIVTVSVMSITRTIMTLLVTIYLKKVSDYQAVRVITMKQPSF